MKLVREDFQFFKSNCLLKCSLFYGLTLKIRDDTI